MDIESRPNGPPAPDSSEWTRASLLKQSVLAAAGLGVGLPLLSTASAVAAASAGKPSGTVSLLCWQGYDDAKAAKPLTSTGVKLSAEYITNNDVIATKLRGGGLGKYDVVTPENAYIRPLVEAKLIQPLDYSRLPATKNYFPEFMKPAWNTIGGKVYSAPLLWGNEPMIYRSDLVPNPPKAWLDLADPKWRGKLVITDNGPDNISLFAKAMFGPAHPYLLTHDQLARVTKLLGQIKKNAVTIAAGFGDAADILTRGDAAILPAGWSYVVIQLKKRGKPAKAFVPKEGTTGWCDNYCIAQNAPNIDAAYAFINTMISAKGDAQIANATSCATVKKDAVKSLTSTTKSLYSYSSINAEIRQTGFYPLAPLKAQGSYATFADWTAAWEAFKAS